MKKHAMPDGRWAIPLVALLFHLDAALGEPSDDLAARTRRARTGTFRLCLVAPDGAPLSGAPVEVEMRRHDFLFGGNIYAFDRFGDPFRNQAYKRAFETIFNYATLPFYWRGYEPERGRPDHGRNEGIVEWCAARDVTAKGHPLVWTNRAGVPPWIEGLPDAEKSATVLGRVRDCVKRFRGRIAAWDVVNEPIHTPPFGGFADRVAQVRAVHDAAREEDPEALLVLNEYHVMSERAGGFYPFVERCLRAGAPIDAVGIQAHEPRFARFDPERMKVVLDRYAELGKKIHLTELAFTSGGQKVLRRQADGSFKGTDETWTEDLQADVVEEFYRHAFAHPAVTAITWWDLADGRSWLPGGGLLRANLTPKPAYAALKRLILEEWRTREKVRTDADGRVSFTGFFGTYVVRARKGDRSLEQVVHLGKGMEDEVRVEFPSPWKVEPEKPRGVFLPGDEVAFRLERSGGPPRVLVRDVGGEEEGTAALEDLSPGRFRLMLRGLGPGHYRLFLDGLTQPAASFAVLPEMGPDPGRGLPDPARDAGGIASDAAISWLVARPGGGGARVSNPDDVADVFHLARLAGLRVLRDRISWQEVEPRPGEYRWGRYGAVAAASRDAGVGVYQILHASPSWSRADRDGKRMPDDLRAAYRFAREAQKGLPGPVVAWEPWNEPDIAVFSNDPADQLAAYQKVTYLGFKAADPKVVVLMVSLALPPGPFIESFLENETGPYFEVYNYHIYDRLEGYPKRAAAHAEVCARFGVADKPMWVTEAGIHFRTPTGDLSLEQGIRQAEFLPKAYALSLGHGTAMHFFFILPYYLENDVQFGLLGRHLGPGPGYVALAALSSALGHGANPRALRGLPEGLKGWLFSRGDGLDGAVVWAEGEVSLEVAGGIEARDLYGRPRSPAADGTLSIGDRATYLIGKPASFAAWKPESSASKAEPSPAPFTVPEIVPRFVFPRERTDKPKEAWRVADDGTLAGDLQVYNFSATPFRGSVRLTGVPGLKVDPGEKAIEVAPGALESFDVHIRWEGPGDPIRKVRAVAIAGEPEGEERRSSAAVIRVVRP